MRFLFNMRSMALQHYHYNGHSTLCLAKHSVNICTKNDVSLFLLSQDGVIMVPPYIFLSYSKWVVVPLMLQGLREVLENKMNCSFTS